ITTPVHRPCPACPPRRSSDLHYLPEVRVMAQRFEVGDAVTWNSEAGQVSGTITAVHTENFPFKGRTRHATQAEPQYEIASDKTDHIAAHKDSALSPKKN